MGGILWGYKNYFNIEGIDCLSRFWFLGGFCLKAQGRKEGRKISILRSASASISHLRKNQIFFLNLCGLLKLH